MFAITFLHISKYRLDERTPDSKTGYTYFYLFIAPQDITELTISDSSVDMPTPFLSAVKILLLSTPGHVELEEYYVSILDNICLSLLLILPTSLSQFAREIQFVIKKG
jgi:hypothetical protein